MVGHARGLNRSKESPFNKYLDVRVKNLEILYMSLYLHVPRGLESSCALPPPLQTLFANDFCECIRFIESIIFLLFGRSRL